MRSFEAAKAVTGSNLKKSKDTMAKKDLLVTDDFHSPTIALLDELYTTYKLWEMGDPESKIALLAHIADRCEAIATLGWIGEGTRNLPFDGIRVGPSY